MPATFASLILPIALVALGCGGGENDPATAAATSTEPEVRAPADESEGVGEAPGDTPRVSPPVRDHDTASRPDRAAEEVTERTPDVPVAQNDLGAEPPPPSQPNLGLAALNDDFSGDALSDAWTVLNRDAAAIEVRDDRLWIRTTQYSVWFHADQGPGLVQTVDGDFHVTTTVRARSARNPDRPVGAGFQFGGLIVRDPASESADRPENYVFAVIGYRGDYLSFETKSTINDLSMVDGPPWSSGDAEVRICRVGSDFRMYVREIGADRWHHSITYDRADLPRQLQVGPIAYSYTQDPDLQASFEHVRFASVTSAAGCTAD